VAVHSFPLSASAKRRLFHDFIVLLFFFVLALPLDWNPEDSLQSNLTLSPSSIAPTIGIDHEREDNPCRMVTQDCPRRGAAE
jgi:hypothetical protein